MTDNQFDAPEFQEQPGKKNNRTLWIILAVIAVVIICCCVFTALGLMFFVPSGRFQQLRYGLVPLLAFL